MSKFSGSQYKGAMRLYREVKREEAKERQAASTPEVIAEDADPGDE